jgi:hypothetical protein
MYSYKFIQYYKESRPETWDRLVNVFWSGKINDFSPPASCHLVTRWRLFVIREGKSRDRQYMTLCQNKSWGKLQASLCACAADLAVPSVWVSKRIDRKCIQIHTSLCMHNHKIDIQVTCAHVLSGRQESPRPTYIQTHTRTYQIIYLCKGKLQLSSIELPKWHGAFF